MRPDEVLFKQQNAPPRFQETDYYFAHTQLGAGRALPSSDMLKTLHAFMSKKFARSEDQVNERLFKSLDETALLALGILLEETVSEALGETGDLAFLEGDEDATESEGRKDDEGLIGAMGGNHDRSNASESESSVSSI